MGLMRSENSLNYTPVADPIKLFFFANKEIFFIAGKLACLLNKEKNHR